MRAFLSYNVAADILISGFKCNMHLYLRMVAFSSSSLWFISILLFVNYIQRRTFFSVLLIRVIIHAINSKLISN